MFLIFVDNHSKWSEVHVVQMNSATASSTANTLRDIFARYGLPKPDNGPQFIADKFKTFLRLNGIKHTTSSPYHPSGLAERVVQSFKQDIKKDRRTTTTTNPRCDTETDILPSSKLLENAIIVQSTPSTSSSVNSAPKQTEVCQTSRVIRALT